MCAYCPQEVLIEAYDKRPGPRSLTLETTKRLLNNIDIPVDIHFTGMSEPFAIEDGVAIFKEVAKRGHHIAVSTTLLGLTPADIDYFATVPIKSFTVHLPDADGHMNHPKDDLFYETLKKTKDIQNVNYLVMGKLTEKTKTILGRDLESHGGLTDRGGNLNVDKMPPALQDDFMKSPMLSGKIICSKNMAQRPIFNPTFFDQYILMANGDLVLCAADYGMKHIIGNLNDMPLSRIIKDKPFQQIQDAMRNRGNTEILCRTCRNAIPFSWRKWLTVRILEPFFCKVRHTLRRIMP